MSTLKLRDVNDFEWQQCLRCYKSDSSTVAEENIKTSKESNEENETDLYLSILDNTQVYQNEFHGCSLGAIMWMTSEKVVMNLMEALTNHKPGCISSDSLHGKLEVINVGDHLTVFKNTNQNLYNCLLETKTNVCS